MASILSYLVPFILFFILASPVMYQVTRKVFGRWVSTPDGLPSAAGVALHALVYTTIVGIIMSRFRKNLRN